MELEQAYTGLYPVQLKTAFGNCNAGETAGFPLEIAQELVKKGMAEPVKPAPKKATTQTAKTKD